MSATGALLLLAPMLRDFVNRNNGCGDIMRRTEVWNRPLTGGQRVIIHNAEPTYRQFVVKCVQSVHC